MSDYRRAYVPGGSYFFTVVTERRAPIFRTETARTILGSAIRHCRQKWPFRLDALVLLDEHCHAIWTARGRYPLFGALGLHQKGIYPGLAGTGGARTVAERIPAETAAARRVATTVLGACLTR